MTGTEYPTVYGLWSPKGGVGRSTLVMHLASTYAKLFPANAVLVIDACPSANLSCALLTTPQGTFLPAAVMGLLSTPDASLLPNPLLLCAEPGSGVMHRLATEQPARTLAG
jgi:cellulose biosynthesis protein BcsQ